MADREELLAKAARDLQWQAVLDALASHASSSLGAGRCRSQTLSSSFSETQAALQETAEMVTLQREGGGVPIARFPDVRVIIERAAKGALLNAPDLRDLSIVLGLACVVRRFLRNHQEDAPGLCALAANLDDLGPLKLSIDRAIDPEGNILESATPELRGLTQHANALKQKIRTRLEAVLASPRFAEILQEAYFAQRENRYVIPVKAERKGEVPGIIHDVSASGATVFIEPRDLVDLNNQIKESDLAVEREARRILQDLSDQAACHEQALLDDLEILGRLDAVCAKAAFAEILQASNPVLNDTGRIKLHQARHPLLVLSRQAQPSGTDKSQEPIVANDIELGSGIRALIISGPNAGGKTVTLKIVGLFALMVRAGLQLPCAAGSEMAFFPEVYAEIGDAQDLTKDLSSFSAHISDMIALLKEAASQSLILLDEPVTATDPTEGAALAQALLLHLAERGFTIVATTHYNPLKAFAQGHPMFANASVGFNVATLSPTYQLIMGMPGGSSAIEIAGRLGMNEELLDHAVRLVNTQERAMELLMEELQEARRQLDEDRRHISALRAETEAAAHVQKELAARLAAAEKETRKTVRKKLTDELLRARAEIQSVVEDLKTDKRLVKTRTAKERLVAVEEAMQARLAPAEDYRPLGELQAGDRVELLGLGTIGVLLESPEGKKRVRVRVGEAEVSTETSRVGGIRDEQEPGRPKADLAKPGRPSVAPAMRMEEPGVVDVRGKTADEALESLQSHLDRAALSGTLLMRIIHGHGTGRLKQVLREHLKASPYVAGFRPGERAEGGDGVTVVQLK
jgi:DNA mismatch repair protein MutS2